MAVLNITFVKGAAWDQTGHPVPDLDFDTSENKTIAASSVQSSAGPARSQWVMLYAEAACRVRIGSSPTALSTDTAIGAGQTLFLVCAVGDKVAVIQF